MAEDKKYAAVYAPWQTFINSVNQLKNGVPSQIDRTVFPGMAGAVQSQIFAGFKFLGLMDDAGKPTEMLHTLATTDDENRRFLVAAILEERYKALFDLNLKQATMAQVSQTLADSYGVSGDTRDKALRFFLSAAEYAGIELSTFILGAKRTTPRKRRNGSATGAGRQRTTEDIEVEEEEIEDTPAPGMSRTVTLRSGGTLTLSASLDVFALKPEDRKFVFDLIDQLSAYESSGSV